MLARDTLNKSFPVSYGAQDSSTTLRMTLNQSYPGHYKTVCRLLLCGLLPVFNLHADAMHSVNRPSMDFLEYLGGVENEIDGQLSSPVELDLEAALVASNSGKQKIDEVKADSEINNEADNEDSVDE